MVKQKVLILCTGNSARSQMAEGLLRHHEGNRFEVSSAGTHPSHVRPEAVTVMSELASISPASAPNRSTNSRRALFDYVLKVCDNAREGCPIYPGHGHRLHHKFEDPALAPGSDENKLAAFRRVRDQIRQYLKGFPDG
jgi:arsenate reductase (thioredoxin)